MGVFHDSENPLLGLFPTEMHIYIYIYSQKEIQDCSEQQCSQRLQAVNNPKINSRMDNKCVVYLQERKKKKKERKNKLELKLQATICVSGNSLLVQYLRLHEFNAKGFDPWSRN